MAATRVRLPYGTPITSIIYGSCHFAARPETSINLTHGPANARKQHLYNLALRVALLIRHTRDVGVRSLARLKCLANRV